MNGARAVPGRPLHGEIWIDEMRARKRDQIGAAGGDDGIDLIGGRDRADAHGGQPRLVANLVGERRLEHATEYRLRIRNRLSGGDVDEIATSGREGARDLNRVVA